MKRDINTGKNHGENFCYYYLHTNGDLIHKSKHADISDFEESDFVKSWWVIDLDNRADVYNMLIRASMLGIRKERLDELTNKWKITDNDTENYVKRVGLIWKMDGNAFCVHSPNFTNLQEDNAGFGDTLFSAVCDFMTQEVNV